MIQFPSPLGVSYFQIERAISLSTVLASFRPLSGYLISKYKMKLQSVCSRNIVSVPSRGILFPNSSETSLDTLLHIQFPSPLGVSYFQILPARARYFAGFSDSFAWQIIFLYIFLISNIHNRLQMQYLCGARQNYLFF